MIAASNGQNEIIHDVSAADFAREAPRIANCILESYSREVRVKAALINSDAVRQGTLPTTAALHDLLLRIESEYREMPGMCVTEPQARRLWALDSRQPAHAF